MADLQQIPGALNITVTAIDDMSIALDFDISLTGYTFTSFVQTISAVWSYRCFTRGNGHISLMCCETSARTA